MTEGFCCSSFRAVASVSKSQTMFNPIDSVFSLWAEMNGKLRTNFGPGHTRLMGRDGIELIRARDQDLFALSYIFIHCNHDQLVKSKTPNSKCKLEGELQEAITREQKIFAVEWGETREGRVGAIVQWLASVHMSMGILLTTILGPKPFFFDHAICEILRLMDVLPSGVRIFVH